MTGRLGRAAFEKVARTLVAAASGLPSAGDNVHNVEIVLNGFAIDFKVASTPTILRGVAPSVKALAWLGDCLSSLARDGHRSVALGSNLLDLTIKIFPYKGMEGVVEAFVPKLRFVVCGPSIDTLYLMFSATGRPYGHEQLVTVRPIARVAWGVEQALRVEQTAHVRVRGSLRHAGDVLDDKLVQHWLNRKCRCQHFMYGIGGDPSQLQLINLRDLTPGTYSGLSSDAGPIDVQNDDDDGSRR